MADLNVVDLLDPKGNFRVGCYLLSHSFAKYDNLHDVLTMYNAHRTGASAYSNKVIARIAKFSDTSLTKAALN